MRVLVASNTYPPADISGVASLVYELAHALGADPAHAVEVLTRENPAQDPYALAVGGSKRAYPLRAAVRYLRLARRRPYNLVHVHESDGCFVVLVHRLARALGLRFGRGALVATLQVSYDRERRAVRTLRDAAGRVLSTPTADERRFARVRARLHSLLGRLTVRLCDRVVAPSWRTKTELEDDYGARDVVVIENGLDLDPSAAVAAPERAADGPVVLYAGRLRTRKAVAVLLAAFQRILPRHPRARLLVVGDGPQRPALQAQARDLGFDPERRGGALEFLGHLDRGALLDLYRRVDVYCLPSTYEGFPVAILEAMAAGLPVLSTTVSGIPEAVRDGATGLLVPPVDVEALAAALDRLLGDRDLRRRLGAAGRRRVEEHFSIAAIVGRHLELWHNLASSSPPPRAPRAAPPTREGDR